MQALAFVGRQTRTCTKRFLPTAAVNTLFQTPPARKPGGSGVEADELVSRKQRSKASRPMHLKITKELLALFNRSWCGRSKLPVSRSCFSDLSLGPSRAGYFILSVSTAPCRQFCKEHYVPHAGTCLCRQTNKNLHQTFSANSSREHTLPRSPSSSFSDVVAMLLKGLWSSRKRGGLEAWRRRQQCRLLPPCGWPTGL